MGKIKDLTGRKFGKLSVINFSHVDKWRQSCWSCKCACGNDTIKNGHSLLQKRAISCGCAKSLANKNIAKKRILVLTGRVFGELTVNSQAKNKRGRVSWLCLCSCGRKTIVTSTDLIQGHTNSCGHLQNASASETSFLNGLELLINEKIIRQFRTFTERGFRFYDGFIQSTGTLIEVDSDAWHSDVLVLENDKFKDEVAKRLGYNIIRYKVNCLDEVNNVLLTIKKV